MIFRKFASGLLLAMLAVSGASAGEGKDGHFAVGQVADRVWRLDDRGSDNVYLVAGTEKALLIDTGLGAGDLMTAVRRLTSLPVVVVVTHGHPDHAGGVSQFAEVYAHPDEFGAIRFHGTRSGREPERLVPVEDGFVFDLGGGRRVRVVATPGHTRGSICLLASDAGILFSGDNDNRLQWQFLPASTTLERYLRTLQALDAREDFTVVLPGHGGPLEKAFISEMIACVQSVLDGSCQDEPYTSPAGEARLCRRGRASVAFDPDRLR